jgi:type II secretory pathway pseudopilin PulG
MLVLASDSMKQTKRHERGFTMPELLVVGTAMLLIIAGMLLLLRPTDYTAAKRNAQRRTALAYIMQGVNAYKADNGVLPPHILGEETNIASEEDGTSLCDDLVPTYIEDLPLDPVRGVALFEGDCATEDQFYMTGFTVKVDEQGRVTLKALAAEKDETITITH